MKRYQPLLFQKLDIRVPGFRIRRLALHRHLPETTDIRPHAHPCSQCLVYLDGQGRQQIKAASYAVQAGATVFLPPRCQHAFRRVANRRPICLIIDFDWRGARRRPFRISALSQSALNEIRQQLSTLAQLPGSTRTPPLLVASMIARLLHNVLQSLSLTGGEGPATSPRFVDRVEKLFASPGALKSSLSEIARAAGYQQDYLNRMVKARCGLTLGQLRSRVLIARVQELLQQSGSIAAIGNALGFDDPNYFTRWFRRQVGVSPGRWRRMVQ